MSRRSRANKAIRRQEAAYRRNLAEVMKVEGDWSLARLRGARGVITTIGGIDGIVRNIVVKQRAVTFVFAAADTSIGIQSYYDDWAGTARLVGDGNLTDVTLTQEYSPF